MGPFLMRRLALLAAAGLLATLAALAPAAPAAAVVKPICFPVVEAVKYTNDFGAPRSGGRIHEGVDLVGAKGSRLVAAVDGTVVDVRGPGEPYTDYSVRIRADDGWYFAYLHMNNDTPGTDDGRATWSQVFAPGIIEGARVRAGELLGYLGDSGNAEEAGAHLHFELRQPAPTVWQSVAVSPYDSLNAATRCPLLGRPAPIGWYLRDSVTPGAPDVTFTYGMSDYGILAGDWDGDGADSEGVFEPAAGRFHLRDDLDGGAPDHAVAYGLAGYVPLAGDWDGDGDDTIGIWEPATGIFHLRNSLTPGPPDESVAYGTARYDPVVGDWDGDGDDTVGVWDPAGQAFYLRNSLSPGLPDITVRMTGAVTTSTPVVGDWDGDGTDTVGVYTDGRWRLLTANVTGASPVVVDYGTADYRPVVGDWNAGGSDSLGAIGPAAPAPATPRTRTWLLRDANTSGPPQTSVVFGTSSDQAVVGNFDASGPDGLARWNRLTGDLEVLQTAGATSTGHAQLPRGRSALIGHFVPGGADQLAGFADGRWFVPGVAGPIGYGLSSYLQVLGDWNGDGIDTIGVWEPDTGIFHLRNTNTPGPPDIAVQYGARGYVPLVGDWNGDGIDTIGVWEPDTGIFHLRNTNTPGPPDIAVQYGTREYQPVVGDWNGDGIDTIGVLV